MLPAVSRWAVPVPMTDPTQPSDGTPLPPVSVSPRALPDWFGDDKIAVPRVAE